MLLFEHHCLDIYDKFTIIAFFVCITSLHLSVNYCTILTILQDNQRERNRLIVKTIPNNQFVIENPTQTSPSIRC